MNIRRTNQISALVGAAFSLFALTSACSERQDSEPGSDAAPTLRPELSDRVDTVGEEVDRRLNAASGGNQPLFYEVIGLPEGLSFSPDDQSITGVPVTAGRYGVVYLVRDIDGDIDYVSFSWNIYESEPSPASPPVAEEEIPDAQPTASVTAPESVAASPASELKPAVPTKPSVATYTVSVVGDMDRFPACWEPQGIVELGKASDARDFERFGQLFVQNECFWLNDGDTVTRISGS